MRPSSATTTALSQPRQPRGLACRGWPFDNEDHVPSLAAGDAHVAAGPYIVVAFRFRDSHALIQHGEDLADLMDTISPRESVCGHLLGEPSAQLRAQITSGRCSSSRPGGR